VIRPRPGDPLPRWTVLIPIKSIERAKSRFVGPDPDLRRRLVIAMAADVLESCLACPHVARVIVVTPDRPVATELLSDLRVAWVPDSGTDLNISLVRALGSLDSRAAGPVAVVPADLPALKGDQLTDALARSASYDTAFVTDYEGTGSTLYAAFDRMAFSPAYGPDSRREHIGAGTHELTFPQESGIRVDVDGPTSLELAIAAGAGRRTQAVRGLMYEPA